MDPLKLAGGPAPGFTLPDLRGRMHTLGDQRGRLVVVNFWSAECPWVARVDEGILAELPRWKDQVVYWPVASNANEQPGLLASVAQERGLPVVLLDRQGEVASLYGAQATPHLFIVDARGMLRYAGAYDDVTFRQRQPTRAYVLDAVRAVLQGRQPEPSTTPAYGCAIVRDG